MAFRTLLNFNERSIRWKRAVLSLPSRDLSGRQWRRFTTAGGDERAATSPEAPGMLPEDILSRISAIPMMQGTRVRKSPFLPSTLRHGCDSFSVYNRCMLSIGWQHQTLDEEYDRLVTNVNLWDVSCQRQVELSGPDAATLAQLISTRDLSKFNVGTGKYTVCTDEDGIVINDPLVLKLADDRFFFSIADRDLELWAKAHASTRGMDVEVRELPAATLALQGPKSTALLRDVLGEDAVVGLKFFNFRETVWQGVRTLVVRAGWSPERGYEILPLPDGGGSLDPKVGAAMYEELVRVGKEKYGLGFGGPLHSRRIEGGMISCSEYQDRDVSALELGLPPLIVNLDMEQNFIGKSALRKLRDDAIGEHMSNPPKSEAAAKNPGAKRIVCGFVFEGSDRLDSPLFSDWDIFRAAEATHASAESAVGCVTAVAFSPRLQAPVGMGLIDVAYADPGAAELLTYGHNGKRRHFRVVSMPFEGSVSSDHKRGSTKSTANRSE